MFSDSANDNGFNTRKWTMDGTLTNAIKTEDSEERGKEFDTWREWVGAKEGI